MVIDQIRKKISESFLPIHLEIHNDSRLHRGSADAETHFRLFLVSDQFDGLNAVKRQRLVFECLKHEMSTGVHALSLKTMTKNEFETKNASAQEAMKCAHKA